MDEDFIVNQIFMNRALRRSAVEPYMSSDYMPSPRPYQEFSSRSGQVDPMLHQTWQRKMFIEKHPVSICSEADSSFAKRNFASGMGTTGPGYGGNMCCGDDVKAKAALRSKENVPQRQREGCGQSRSPQGFVSRTLTLNATINDALQWSKFQGPHLSILYDIYAVLDSEVRVNTFGGLEFDLRDQSGSVKATYFEIEEPMVKANLGDWLRIEAVIRSWGFQVTHLKLAESTYLIGLREKIAASRRALEERVRCQN